ncbi:putative amidase [Cocos nucifera]|uniref:Putative amidase n=1 Tax=Cocos nucifera TaxID=13894 RepID=A0A8K0N8H5_COCNU|nr:putative amidase [Cocos nucifera]
MEMTTPLASPFLSTLFLVLLVGTNCRGFEIKEATIDGIQQAFNEGSLTSRQLVEYYLDQIQALNPLLHAVIEVNPDAVRQADRADRERRNGDHLKGGLHGIPVLLKDIIATRDRLSNTAGSFALLWSVVPRDAGVVRRLRQAGAVILGKASLSEWANFRTLGAPNGWSARGGQGRNPYVLSADPCGSSSGSAIAAAANMAAVTLGTETDGSIICPAARNSVVGIKPTVGLTSRAGVIPISPRQDTVGSLADVIAFNNEHSVEERTEEFGQLIFLAAQHTSGIGPAERSAIANMTQISMKGLERLMIEKQLDAVVTPDANISPILAIGGYPGISVRAGYELDGHPCGISFGGLKGSEPKLIEIAYAFEQTTNVRKPPSYKP